MTHRSIAKLMPKAADRELTRHRASRPSCRGTRLMQLQLPAAAAEMIATQDGAARHRTGDSATHATAITCLTGLRARIPVVLLDSSTGS
jgi:hypothetical protein